VKHTEDDVGKEEVCSKWLDDITHILDPWGYTSSHISGTR